MTLVKTMTIPATNDAIRQSFQTGVLQRNAEVKKVFIAVDGDWKDPFKRMTEVDKERFAGRKLQGQASVRRRIAQGYSKDIYRKTISITRDVSGEAYKALTRHDLISEAIGVGEDVADRICLDMAHVLTYSQSLSYVDMDGFDVDTTVGNGLSIVNNAHTLKESGTTYSNLVTGSPSLGEQGLILAEDFFNYNCLDNFGQRYDMTPDTIITTRKAVMQHRVARLMGSDAGENDDAFAGTSASIERKNTFKRKYSHLVVDFDVDALNVTDSNKSFWWFLASLNGRKEQRFQAYYVRWMSPETSPVEKDEDKWTMSYTGRSAYGLGAVSGRGISLSPATS